MSSAIKAKRHQYRFLTDGLAAVPYSPNLLNAVSFTAAAAARTLILQVGAPAGPPGSSPVGGFAVVTYGVSTTWVSATQIRADTFGSFDGGVTFYRLESSSISAGVDTLSDYIATKNTGGAAVQYTFTLVNDNYTHIKVVFSATGAAAGDTITVQAAAGCQ